MTINRPILVQKLVQRKHNGMIKIITGLRRSGKSYLLFNLFQNYLLQNNVPIKVIIKVDLEDFDAYPLREPRNLLDYISSATKDNDRYYIFIDEVQHLAHFEDVLNTLQRYAFFMKYARIRKENQSTGSESGYTFISR